MAVAMRTWFSEVVKEEVDEFPEEESLTTAVIADALQMSCRTCLKRTSPSVKKSVRGPSARSRFLLPDDTFAKSA